MIKRNIIITLSVLLTASAALYAQDPADANSFDRIAASVHQKLDESNAELNALRKRNGEEEAALIKQLNTLESELNETREKFQQTTRLLDSRSLDLGILKSEIESREKEATYVSNLLEEYARGFQNRLHIAEIELYETPLKAALDAPGDIKLSQQQIYQAQTVLLETSLERLHSSLGGMRFEGTASDSTGSIHHGTFVLVGPVALFHSDDGHSVGTADLRLGSLVPTIIPFSNPTDSEAASEVISKSKGLFPLDPTLGDAHKIAETEETFMDEFQKGGIVMYAIFGLASAALLVAVLKFIGMLSTRTPSQRKIDSLLDAVANNDESLAADNAETVTGPIGAMLRAGVKHIKEPRELIEEVMYEKVLGTRLKLERFLPFIGISASAAPLLGLLGTVTGIINTFKQLMISGGSNVKSLSGGISEALITTKWGLIVAIPSLLIHAFLSRKARGIINKMEKAAVSLVNQISKSDFNNESAISEPVQQTPEPPKLYKDDSAGGIMNTRVFSVDKTATIAEVIDKMRSMQIDDDVDAVYIVDENGKFQGHVLIQHLFRSSDQTPIESVIDKTALYVNTDTHKDEIQSFFKQHRLTNVPVVDHEGQLVGRITRNGN